MKAVIMAGGEGTRLRPLTTNQPKPMLPLANKPMAEHIISLLRRHGIEEIVVTVAYLANTIRSYFGDGSDFGVKLIYATEETPLGTAGSVGNARDELTERFLVISGDVLTDVDLSALIDFHEQSGAVATLALKAMENPVEFGIVICDEQGHIERFLEKPTWGQVFSDTVNTGIYVLEPEVFDEIPEGAASDFSSDVFPALLEKGRPLFGWVTKEYWEDVGTLDAYLSAHRDVLDGRVGVDIDAFPVRPQVFLGEGAEVDPSAVLEAPVIIGDNCRVGPGAHVGPYTVLGANVNVGDTAELTHAVFHDNCFVGPLVTARGCVIGRSSELRQGAHLEEGVVVGDRCRIGRRAVITSGVRIYPNKIVEPEATVTTSLVWESRGTRSLFGRYGVSGLANVDLSPELAVRVAMAYATTLPRGATVTTSRDSSRAARVLKRAVMVGLNAAGVNVEDLEVATFPVTRFQVRTSTALGGLTVRLVADDPQSVIIRFVDADGVDIDEGTQRRIERLFDREEGRRVLAAEIGDIDFPAHANEQYATALSQDVDLEAIRDARFKLVLDYSFGAGSLVMPSVLAKLGADVLVMNPLLSTVGLLGYHREVHAARVADLVVSSGAHLGALISPDGEQLTIVDDRGHILSDEEALLCFTRLVAEARPGAVIATPVNATWRANEVCAELGAETVWSKLSTAHLMEVAITSHADLAADATGGVAFPKFGPGFDAASGLIHLLELLATRNDRLSEVLESLPAVNVMHAEISTPFEQKGTVMRALVERARSDDGVKTVDEGGWTLIAPDPEEPVTHIWAEGDSDVASAERIERATLEVAEILQSAR
jgi:mannose-1-phosphate guanylyltransferase / phosphomannomutase